MITITDVAKSKIIDLLMEENNPNLSLRAFIQGGGCSGFNYGFTFDEIMNEDDAECYGCGNMPCVKQEDPMDLRFCERCFKENEKINCAFFFIVNKFENNNFEVTLQVNSSRPVYNSTFTSPILNINDKDVSFKYIEFENLIRSIEASLVKNILIAKK